jgi:rRNA maturation endonuclease Nob1
MKQLADENRTIGHNSLSINVSGSGTKLIALGSVLSTEMPVTQVTGDYSDINIADQLRIRTYRRNFQGVKRWTDPVSL